MLPSLSHDQPIRATLEGATDIAMALDDTAPADIALAKVYLIPVRVRDQSRVIGPARDRTADDRKPHAISIKWDLSSTVLAKGTTVGQHTSVNLWRTGRPEVNASG